MDKRTYEVGSPPKRVVKKLVVETFRKEMVILGGGLGGCMVAYRAAEEGWSVTILEKNSDILRGTSDITPGRMGLGFHYVDARTALQLLKATTRFNEKFPNFHRAQDRVASDPVRHGRYYIVKDSEFTVDEIEPTFEELSASYKRYVKKHGGPDGGKAYFGHPANLYKVLTEDQYSGTVKESLVKRGYETAEPLLDWERFRAFFTGELKKFPKINIIYNANVVKPVYLDTGEFEIHYQTGTQEHNNQKIVAPYVVNCTWQNSEQFDVALGFKSDSALNRTNRLKVLAHVKLPEKLKNMHSSFFMIGPHCMFTNLGDGYALMSYAPVTNIDDFTGLHIPPDWTQVLDGHYDSVDPEVVMPELKRVDDDISVLSDELKQYMALYPGRDRWDIRHMLLLYYGHQIRQGVARYIPDMKDAELIGVRFGIVKTFGQNVNINDPHSSVHERSYDGIQEQQIGWITNDLMKLLYGVTNADEVLRLLEQHCKADLHIAQDAYAAAQAFEAYPDMQKKFINSTIKTKRRNFLDTSSRWSSSIDTGSVSSGDDSESMVSGNSVSPESTSPKLTSMKVSLK